MQSTNLHETWCLTRNLPLEVREYTKKFIMIGMVYFVVALQYTVKQEELARKKKNKQTKKKTQNTHISVILAAL